MTYTLTCSLNRVRWQCCWSSLKAIQEPLNVCPHRSRQMVLSFLAKDPSDARSQHNVMEALCHVIQSASGHRCFSGRTVYVGSPEMLPAFPQYEEAPSASFSNNAGMGYHTAQCMADKRHHCHPRRPPPTPPTRDTVGSSSVEFFDI